MALFRCGAGNDAFLEPRQYMAWASQSGKNSTGSYTSGTGVSLAGAYGRSVLIAVKDISGTISVSSASGSPSMIVYGVDGDTMTQLGTTLGSSLPNVAFSDYDYLIVCVSRDQEYAVTFTITES